MRLDIHIAPELYAEIRKEALEKHTTVSALIRSALAGRFYKFEGIQNSITMHQRDLAKEQITWGKL